MNISALKKIFEEPYILERPQLKECYVVYIDILGYKHFFDTYPDKVESLLDDISNGYQNIVRGINMINSFFFVEKKIELRCFSDNLLVFCEVPDKNSFRQTLMLLVEIAKEIQRILIFDYGLFVRGAIVKGLFAANEMFVFGNALIDAVTKEESEAKNPRVIISQSVIDDMQSDELYDDPLTQRIYDDLVNIYALFESNSTYELAIRCFDAFKLFDDIIAEIPFAMPFDDEKLLQNLRKSCNDMMGLVSKSRNDNNVLEQVYKKIINKKSNMFDILNSVAKSRRNQIIKCINTMISSSCFKDEDGVYVVDYLAIADYTSIFKPEIIKILLGKFFRELDEFPGIIEKTSEFLDKSKINDIRLHILLLHRKVIHNTLKEDEESYINYASNRTDKYEERIIKKHLWSMQYHNWHCQKLGFNDLIINCELSIGKSSSLFVEKIDEVVNN